MPNIDETELARLGALARQYLNLVQPDNGGIVHPCLRAALDLVVEVRRLREKVEAWEWLEEVRSCKPWNDHPYWEACGNSSKRGKIFDSAVDEYKLIYKAAREAVHADRE